MRHNYAGMAIPTFPYSTSDGGLLPAAWDYRVALHFAHRLMAVVIAAEWAVAMHHYDAVTGAPGAISEAGTAEPPANGAPTDEPPPTRPPTASWPACARS